MIAHVKDAVIAHLKDVADGVSIGIIVTTLAGWLPPLAAALSIAWTVYQWYHSAPRVAARALKKAKNESR